jgi:signal recognition particle subunit SRP72
LIRTSVLRIEPNDKDALQTKLFLLLQTEQYDAALSIVGAGENSTGHDFERSYSLYRLHREQEAVDGLKSIKEGNSGDERGALHLEAQLVRLASDFHSYSLTDTFQNYRRSSYQAAFDLYSQLLDSAEPVSRFMIITG